MDNSKLILINKLCSSYEIDMSFIEKLHHVGLIEMKYIEETHYIHKDRLADLEKMIRLHKELGVNTEGIDVIFNLLQKVETLQKEVNHLKNKLFILKE